MSKSLSGFMSANKIVKENVFYPASRAFLDDKGDYLLWELKSLTSEEDSKIRESSYFQVPAKGKNGKVIRGQTVKELSGETYTAKLAVASVEFPDLQNAELQDSYGVKTPVDLLRAMLDPGELANLMIKVQELCGFDIDMDELVDDAKN